MSVTGAPAVEGYAHELNWATEADIALQWRWRLQSTVFAFTCDLQLSQQVSGIEGRHVVFLLADSQIVDEAMLADINGLLNTGEITGIVHMHVASLKGIGVFG